MRTLAVAVTYVLGVCAIPAGAQSVRQREPQSAQRPVASGAFVLSEQEGTLVWRASDGQAFSLRTLADSVAPIVWFSPDEPLLRGGAKLPQPFPNDANASPTQPRVYFNILLVTINPAAACAPLQDERIAGLDLAWNDDRAGAVSIDYPPLECLDSVKIRFFFYYSSEVGVSAHANDFESVQINVRVEPDRPVNGTPLCADDGGSEHCAFITGVFGSAHGIAWYTNGLNVDKNRDTLVPVTVLVEEGKHASAPDRNSDGAYTPGFDVDIHPNDAWGIRDTLRTRWLQSPAFRADMAKRRLPKDRVFPPNPNWRIAETWVVSVLGGTGEPGAEADALWRATPKYELVNMHEAQAAIDGATVSYCDKQSDQLSGDIPLTLGCAAGLPCEHLVDLIGGEEGCRRTRVQAYSGWLRVKHALGTVNAGGTHDEYLTWPRFFRERIALSVRVSGKATSGAWMVPIAWNVPGIDGWLSARLNFWRSVPDDTPTEGPVDVVYSISAARYLSFYAAAGRDTIPSGDAQTPGAHAVALESGFKWRFEVPVIGVFSGVRVGIRADNPTRLRYPRIVMEFGGGSW